MNWSDPERKVLAMVTGIGTMKSTANIMALGLMRVDLTRAYWLVAGIAGIDPADASLGSQCGPPTWWTGTWATRSTPGKCPRLGLPLFSRRASTPMPRPARRPRGDLRAQRWAAELGHEQTKDLTLPDLPGMAQARAVYAEPAAQRPPFVLKGAHLAAMTLWHGALMNDWAHWVAYWSEGQGNFVTSAMEDSGTAQALTAWIGLGKPTMTG